MEGSERRTSSEELRMSFLTYPTKLYKKKTGVPSMPGVSAACKSGSKVEVRLSRGIRGRSAGTKSEEYLSTCRVALERYHIR